MKNRYLVVYDYGQGGSWAFIHAESADQILQRFPELRVVDEIPSWMTEKLRRNIEQSETHDLDAPPEGLLANILEARDVPTESGDSTQRQRRQSDRERQRRIR